MAFGLQVARSCISRSPGYSIASRLSAPALVAASRLPRDLSSPTNRFAASFHGCSPSWLSPSTAIARKPLPRVALISAFSPQRGALGTAFGVRPLATHLQGDAPAVDLVSKSSSKVEGELASFDILERAYFQNKSQTWAALSDHDRQCWEQLGWHRFSWDAYFFAAAPPSAAADWGDLTEAEKTVAEKLGYNERLWNEDEGEVWKTNAEQKWDQLESAHRRAWEELGWTKLRWSMNAFSSTSVTAWDGLSAKEKNAAVRLGYTPDTWMTSPDSSNENRVLYAAFVFIVIGFLLYVASVAFESDRKKMDKQEDQVEAVDVRRVCVQARSNWKDRCEDAGFLFHSAAGIRWSPDWMGSYGHQDPYWCEDAAYVFSARGADELSRASWEIHNMCLEAVERVVNDEGLMDRFEIPVCTRDAVRRSWQHRQPDLIGRFDMLYDGQSPPKLLEYNADTPTLLIESSAVQAQWREDRHATGIRLTNGSSLVSSNFTQFNHIESALLASWPQFARGSAEAAGLATGTNSTDLHWIFAAQRASVEEACNIDYLARTARRAGLSTEPVELSDLHVDSQGRVRCKSAGQDDFGGAALGRASLNGGESVAEDGGRLVQALWKLYPYEWLAEEELGTALDWHGRPDPGMIWAEPPWKLVVSNKAILPLLWEMFPDHPNLLPAFFTASEAKAYEDLRKPSASEEWGWVSKPRFGREGIGIRYSFGAPSLESFGRSAQEELDKLAPANAPYNPGLLKQLEDMGRHSFGTGGASYVSSGHGHLLQERADEAAHQHADLRGDLPFPPLGGPVFQLYQDTETFNGRRPVIGSWVIFGKPEGICVREDTQRTTDNDSCFTPHLVERQQQHVLDVHQSTDGGTAKNNVSGTYKLRGQLRGGGVFYNEEKSLYLLRNCEDEWMFTAQEGGGVDGSVGLAVAVGSKPDGLVTSVGNTTWAFADPGLGEFQQRRTSIVISARQSEEKEKARIVSPEQARLRTELYGDAGGKVVDARGDSEPRSGTGGTVHNSAWYRNAQLQNQQPQHQQQQGQQQQQQRQQGQQHGSSGGASAQPEDKARHGRKSGQAWKKYGSKSPTGTFGQSMAKVGGSGGS
eukprot:TRINITY_DN6810_c1_g1_i1.p1 TRINITY_DN6810_c1_g1~~TRINITY_DN6810_c1_g1_i1.p1  ORF type:complete len:1098 (-),score=155.66 TRINITY_DN6810_c1_g1_i1:84-3356(-)